MTFSSFLEGKHLYRLHVAELLNMFCAERFQSIQAHYNMFRIDLFRMSTMEKGPVNTGSQDLAKEGFRLLGRWSAVISVAVESQDRRG